MKNILRFAVVAAVFMGSTTMGSAQTGAVELKDGGGTFISSHNSITAANAAIPASISQGYIIELKNTYTGVNETFPIVFTARTGASVANTITLRPASGVSSVTISDDATEIIELDDADYIIIDGRAGGTGTAKALKIENTATNNECITLSGGASYNTVRYCDIFNNSTTTAGRSIFITTSTGSTGNSYNLIEHCKIEGGRYGINLNGTTTNANVDNKIYGCEIFNNHFAGIWVQSGNEGVEIDSNEIYHTSTYQSNTNPYGILFDSQTDTAIITRNKIKDIDVSATGDIIGIGVRSVSGTNLTYIVNNFISFTKSNGSFEVYGIDYGGSGVFNSQIYFNTIRIGGTQTNTSGTSGNIVSACIYKDATSTSADFDILNNILINNRTGGNSGVQHVALGVKNAAGNFNLDYNTYNSAGDLTRWDGTAYADIASHQAAVPTGNELNSNEATVDLVSATDLHVAGNSLGDFDLKALPLTNVLNDIDNDGRGPTTYRGADDNPANPIVGKRNEIGVVSIDEPFAGGCNTTQTVKVTYKITV